MHLLSTSCKPYNLSSILAKLSMPLWHCCGSCLLMPLLAFLTALFSPYLHKHLHAFLLLFLASLLFRSPQSRGALAVGAAAGARFCLAGHRTGVTRNAALLTAAA